MTKPTSGHTVTVPFVECSREEATKFLSVLYSLEPHMHIGEASGLSIACLGDRYGMEVRAVQPQQLFHRRLYLTYLKPY